MFKLSSLFALTLVASSCASFIDILTEPSPKSYAVERFTNVPVRELTKLIGSPTEVNELPENYQYLWADLPHEERVCAQTVIKATNQGQADRPQTVCKRGLYYCKLVADVAKQTTTIETLRGQIKTTKTSTGETLGTCPDWLISPIRRMMRHEREQARKQQELAAQ